MGWRRKCAAGWAVAVAGAAMVVQTGASHRAVCFSEHDCVLRPSWLCCSIMSLLMC